MTPDTQGGTASRLESRLVGGLVAGVCACLVGIGGLLWWREGEKLFTDGLIAAIARCF